MQPNIRPSYRIKLCKSQSHKLAYQKGYWVFVTRILLHLHFTCQFLVSLVDAEYHKHVYSPETEPRILFQFSSLQSNLFLASSIFILKPLQFYKQVERDNEYNSNLPCVCIKLSRPQCTQKTRSNEPQRKYFRVKKLFHSRQETFSATYLKKIAIKSNQFAYG